MKKFKLFLLSPLSIFYQTFTMNPLVYYSFDKTTSDVSGNGFRGNGIKNLKKILINIILL